MAWVVHNITDEPHQVHRLLFAESEIVLTLRFYPTVQMWCFDAAYKDWSVSGERLTVGALHIQSQNRPFDFLVLDNSGTGLDPFQANDFATGRCSLLLLETEDMESIRGGKVPP